MRPVSTWTAFLVILFGIVGLCGLFASYAPSIPLERADAREAILDQVLAAGPGGQASIEPFRPQLANLATLVLDTPGPLEPRVAKARLMVADEGRREAASVAYRTRLMLGVVTLLAAALGAGILAMSVKQGSIGAG